MGLARLPHRIPRRAFAVLFLALPLAIALARSTGVAARGPNDDVDYVADIEHAVDRIGEECRALLDAKEIDWKKVGREFVKAAKKTKSDDEHFVQLVRLLARLRDGHAEARWLPKDRSPVLPEEWRTEKEGPGMFWCTIDGDLYVKNAWNAAEDNGVEPGMRIVTVDGEKAEKWLQARIEELSDVISFSTEQQARFFACHQGLADVPGTRLKLELVGVDGKKTKRTITITKANPTPWGPAYAPEGTQNSNEAKDLYFAKLPQGYGWLQIRRCKEDLPRQIDVALEALGDVDGLILDFRGNSGGGFDHEDLMGRFVPKGSSLDFAKHYESTGAHPYGGPIVVIVDATVRSAGETASSIFREDGRAYLIGESPTAGMSSQKTTIELPSGLAELYVSTNSNLGRANGGKGLEGIGTIPHELVEFKATDLAAKRDTLIRRACELLADYPVREVPYDPAKAGWRQ